MVWNPWRELGDRHPEVEVVYAPCSVPGLYFPDEAAIVIAVGLSRVERRSVIAEELGHHTLGHRPHPDGTETNRMEVRARRWASSRLVELSDLAEAITGARTWFDVAEDLEVTTEMLEGRVRDLTSDERDVVRGLVGRRELDL